MPRLFGTNGVRGVVGQTMTAELALDLGRSLGTWLRRQEHWTVEGERPRVVVGTDHRTSGPMLAAAVGSGLLATGCDVLQAGPAPTPALQYAVKQRPDAAAGVIVTASHNPPQFNGIKFCRGDGREMEPTLEDEVEAVYFDRAFDEVDWDATGEALPIDDVVADYHAGIRALVDVEAIREAGLTVVTDTANGAAAGSLPRLLTELGCRVVTLNAQPDGTFPGHPSEPVEANAGDIKAVIERVGADLGVMVDGDADRSIFLDETATYHPGERSLALLAHRWVERKGGGIVCTPVATSSIVEEMVKGVGGTVEYTVVGSPKVAAAMVASKAVFGGEENGGLIFPEFQYTRDAAMTVAAMLELVATDKRTLSELMATVPSKAFVKLKTEVPDAAKAEVLAGIKARLEADGAPAGGAVREVDARDGVKAYLEAGWVLVRPSGTEPIMRVYAEADDAAVAQEVADAFMGLLESVRQQVVTA